MWSPKHNRGPLWKVISVYGSAPSGKCAVYWPSSATKLECRLLFLSVFTCVGERVSGGRGPWICQSISPIDGNLLFANWKKHWRRNTQLGCPESKHTNTHWRAEGAEKMSILGVFLFVFFFFGGGKKNSWTVWQRKSPSSTGKTATFFGENNNIALQNTHLKIQNNNVIV